VDQRQRIAVSQIGRDVGIQRVVVQQRIEPSQDGIGLLGEFGNPREDVFIRIVIDQHDNTEPLTMSARSSSPYHSPASIHAIFPVFHASD